MPRNKSKAAEQLNAWREKYPDYVTKIYLPEYARKNMNLTLKEGDTREDGYVFKQYFIRNGNEKLRAGIYEHWLSPEALTKVSIKKAIQKRANSDSNKAFIKRYKRMKGCSLCGWNKSNWGLHFDHKDTTQKRMDVSRMIGYSRQSIKDEIRKCTLLCANCHSIRTEKQFATNTYFIKKRKELII